jgi:hypothetical protein
MTMRAKSFMRTSLGQCRRLANLVFDAEPM